MSADSVRLHIVLFQPEIPQNTGNVGRMCAYTGARLHLIHPLGFTITDKHLRRAGMDYWRSLDVHEHGNFEEFSQSAVRPKRLWLFSTQAERSFWDATFEPGDGLLFGRETAGCPPWLHGQIGPERSLRIPQFTPELRSLNLATSAGIAAYEALRQVQGKS